MSSALISRSPDLKRLRDEGFSVQVKGAYLVVSNIPYVTPAARVSRGVLVCPLDLAGDITTKPQDHVMRFSGEAPCEKNGSPIRGLENSSGSQDLGHGIVVERSFSNKPIDGNGYPDYYAKVTRYADILSAPAHALDPTADPRAYSPIETPEEESPFVYLDTNSSRAQITAISGKIEGQRIAIVGVGGTGSYVLDLVAKCPVREIHLFDGDRLLQHNAFRAPGAAQLCDLQQSPSKVDHFARVYSAMHKRIVPHHEFVTTANLSALEGFDFVFLCMDASETKRAIIEFLVGRSVRFADTGVGIDFAEGALTAMARVTSYAGGRSDHLPKRISCRETADDDYSSNIQIAEFNSLCATLAVIRWKKLCGFYLDLKQERHTTYTVSGNLLLSEDLEA